jgi:hypothetical protein
MLVPYRAPNNARSVRSGSLERVRGGSSGTASFTLEYPAVAPAFRARPGNVHALCAAKIFRTVSIVSASSTFLSGR